MPPEIRKDQARKFNDPESEIKHLIATNAVNNIITCFKFMQIGMGVNLKIRRIIFQTLMRMTSNGEVQQIDEHEIKQIAGRAGRFSDK